MSAVQDNKILALEIFQPFAHYRNPYTWDHPQTFPLPPRSTVIGMLQNLIGDFYGASYREDWKGLEMYIAGSSAAKFRTFTRYYKGSKFGFDKCSGRIVRTSDKKIINGPTGFSADPTTPLIEELFNVNLFVFLRGINNDLLSKIKDEAGKKLVYLGRAEDLAFIRNCSEIQFASDVEGTSALIDDYGFWIRTKEHPEENFSAVQAWHLPIHTEYLIDGNPAQSRSELIFNREKLERSVEWSNRSEGRTFYIPPFSEIKKHGSLRKIKFMSSAGEREFTLADEGWIKSNEALR